MIDCGCDLEKAKVPVIEDKKPVDVILSRQTGEDGVISDAIISHSVFSLHFNCSTTPDNTSESPG